jgi:hypothetical protein
MKVLCSDADCGVWQLGYAFDLKRKAVLLVAGDKALIAEETLLAVIFAGQLANRQEW